MDLSAASKEGNLEQVEALIKGGADPNEKNEHGIPVLHTAAKHGHVAVMKALLAAGADLEGVTNDGRTAFDFATDLCMDPAPTSFLLKAGAKVAKPEHSIRNAWSKETKQLLSDHFELPIPAPRPKIVLDPPSKAEWKTLLPKIEAVFASLATEKILCIPDAGFTQGMAHSALATAINDGADASGGWCFTTSQDMDRAQSQGRMPIGYGSDAGTEEAVVAVGKTLVAAFEAAGFAVEWAGSASMRPTVKVRSAL